MIRSQAIDVPRQQEESRPADGPILVGYNHDIPFAGTIFHVQTEYYPNSGKPRIETHVYQNGRIIASKTRTTGTVRSTADRRRARAEIQQAQKEMIKALLAGHLPVDGGSAGTEPGIANTAEKADRPASAPHTLPRMAKVAPAHSPVQDLELRRDLIRFARAVGDRVPVEVDDVHERLRSILTSLAILMSRDVRLLRQDDLADLVMLRSETLDYLREGEARLEKAVELWRAFTRLAAGFRGINDRITIVHHDYSQLTRVTTRLERSETSDQPLGEELTAILKSCRGRDAALDELLDNPRELTAASVWPELERIVASLSERLKSVS